MRKGIEVAAAVTDHQGCHGAIRALGQDSQRIMPDRAIGVEDLSSLQSRIAQAVTDPALKSWF